MDKREVDAVDSRFPQQSTVKGRMSKVCAGKVGFPQVSEL